MRSYPNPLEQSIELPKKVLSNRGPQFVLNFIRSYTFVLQTSFGPISVNSLSISTVSMVLKRS